MTCHLEPSMVAIYRHRTFASSLYQRRGIGRLLAWPEGRDRRSAIVGAMAEVEPLLFRDPRNPQSDADYDPELLGHGPVVETLKRLLGRLEPPSCIALYGSWGAGKSSIMAELFRRRQADGATKGLTLWFDPWMYEGRDDLVGPLMTRLIKRAEELDFVDRLGLKRRLWAGLKVALAFTTRVGVNLAIRSAGGWGDYKPEDYAKLLEEASIYHDELEGLKSDFKALVDQLVDGVEGVADAGTSSYVVLLDDLDRCLPENVVSLIEAIKLFLCADAGCRIHFVFALDRDVVGRAIQARYPQHARFTGEQYLEKIFDFSLDVPQSAERAREYVERLLASKAGLADVLKGGLGDAEVVARVLSEPIFANPRVIKRTLNRLWLALDGRDPVDLPEPHHRRFVTWVAGVERFRSFRSFFFSASRAELAVLHELVPLYEQDLKPASPPQREGVRLERVLELLNAPGFCGYYDLLGLRKETIKDVLRQRQIDPHTLGEFDERLRSRGL